MNILNRIILTLFLLSGALIADEENYDKPFMEEGYYKVVESVLQIPSLQFKDSINELCYIKFWRSEDWYYGYFIYPLERKIRKINFIGKNIYYEIDTFYDNQVDITNKQIINIDFESKKGSDIIFQEKNLFMGEVTRKVVLTYLGKDLKQAVKKLK